MLADSSSSLASSYGIYNEFFPFCKKKRLEIKYFILFYAIINEKIYLIATFELFVASL
jgi:hypothetical protein